MLGTLLLKPLEAKIHEEREETANLESYCVVTVANTHVESKPSKNGGKYPIWEDAVTIRPGQDLNCTIQLLYKGLNAPNNLVGSAQINLQDVEQHGKTSKWYELTANGNVTGQILVEMAYSAGEYPPDKVYLSEASKLINHYTTTHAAGKIKGDEDPIPEEEEK